MQTKKTASNKEAPKKTTEEIIKVTGVRLVSKVKELIKEGNVRKITILDKNERTILSIPLTIGVVGFILAPIFAAVAGVAALVTECQIKIEREK